MISLRITLGNDRSGHYLDAGRSKDWWAQAIRDLAHAEDSRGNSMHEWACFAAQQAAEKAVKALYFYLGYEARGNAVARLIYEVPGLVMMDHQIIERARVLDTYYIPCRYPDSHAEGAPFERYGPLQSEQAMLYAGEILEFVRNEVTRREDGDT